MLLVDMIVPKPPTSQIMFGIEKAHMIIDEMIMDGHMVETNRSRALAPVAIMDKALSSKGSH